MSGPSLRSRALILIRAKMEGAERAAAEDYVRRDDKSPLALRRFIAALQRRPDLDDARRRIPLKHPDTLRDAALARFEAGEKPFGISLALSLPEPTVRRWIRDAGESPSERARAIKEEALDDLRNGYRQIDVARKYGLSKGTVSDWVKEWKQEGKLDNMASRMSQAERLGKRCEAVGWPTKYTGDGIRVTTPKGPYHIHLTPSDRNAHLHVLRDLEDKGLIEAEAELAKQKLAARQEKLAADRKAAEEKTEQLLKRSNGKAAANKAALMRAAGPYLGEPEYVELAWFRDPHPAPWMRWVWLTPALCDYLLEHHNLPGKPGQPGTNRPQSEHRIAYYRDALVSGQWHLTHQGMAMNTEAKVQDGQHRLAAIVAAGDLLERLRAMDPKELAELLRNAVRPDGKNRYAGILDDDGNLVDELRVPAAFFVGMPKENFAAIDDVLLRDAAQLFTMAGEKNGGTLKAAARLVSAYRSADPRWRVRRRMTNLDSMGVAEEGGDLIREAATAANSHAKKVPMANGPFAAGYYILKKANGEDNVFVEAFFHGILHGLKLGTRTVLDDDDPRQALRTTLKEMKEKGDTPRPLDQLGLMLLAWNYMVKGKHLRRYRWTKASDIPEVEACHDRGEYRSAIPRALIGEVELPEMVDA